MLARRSARAALVACALFLLTAAVALAKPQGIPTYKQCTTKTKCSANAYSNPNGTGLTISLFNKKCPEFSFVLGNIGSVNPNRKTGKFKIAKVFQAQSPTDQTSYPFNVKIAGTVKFKKSIIGSYTITTTAPDCPASGQKANKIKLKFAGVVYGG
jgi:hypothetical protein